jgi:hypothetical protein
MGTAGEWPGTDGMVQSAGKAAGVDCRQSSPQGFAAGAGGSPAAGRAGGLAFQWIIGSTTLTLGTLFAERQILYDRQRGLGALNREVALAETLSRSPVIMDWARAESVAPLRNRGLAELEHYRAAFVDGSYFFVVESSGNYYFNDRDGSYSGDQLRYRLSPTIPAMAGTTRPPPWDRAASSMSTMTTSSA